MDRGRKRMMDDVMNGKMNRLTDEWVVKRI